MNYGRAIRLIRTSRGIRQRELARRVETDPSHISLIETGKRVPSLPTLEAICLALEVPPYLIILLASEGPELRGVNQEQARALGVTLLETLVGVERKRK